jgi:hypothetical protein
MTDQKQRISTSIKFPISEFDKIMVDAILLMPPPSCWSAFNALRHLNRGWRLRVEDPEMAAFRSITAEEEAATALILSLKRHRYKGANKLNHRNHVHKNAIIPFVDVVSRVYARFRDIAPPVELLWDEEQTPNRLILRVKVPNPVGGFQWALPLPPLNFFSFENQPGIGMVRLDFAAGIEQIATEAKTESIIEYLRERANFRNKLLYAAAAGYPEVSGDIEVYLRKLHRNVMTILRIYFMVDPYSKHQGFFQQCLDAFLRMLNLVPKDVRFE